MLKIIDFTSFSLFQTWLFFVLFGAIIVVLAFFLPRFVLDIFKKSRFKPLLIGVVFLAPLTSLPEFFSTMFSVIINDYQYALGYSQSFANIVGANFFSGTILVILDLVFFRYYYLRRIGFANKLTLPIVILVNFLFLLLNFFPDLDLVVGNVSFFAIGLIGMYIGFLVFLFWKQPAKHPFSFQEETRYFDYRINPRVLLLIILTMLGLLLGVFLLFVETGRYLQTVYALSPQSIGGIFFAITTAFPELLGALSLFALRLPNVAISVVFGSHFFNLVLFMISSLIFTEPAFSHLATDASNWRLVLLTLLSSGLFFCHLRFHVPKPHPLYFILPLIICLLFVIGWTNII